MKSEVDLEYPAELHDKHNDYPLAAEHLEITSDMLLDYQKETYPKEKLCPTKKLTPNLQNKSCYTVHYSNLKYYQVENNKNTPCSNLQTIAMAKTSCRVQLTSACTSYFRLREELLQGDE